MLRLIFITTPMNKAKLIYKDKTVYSLDFEDIYFDSKNGVDESRFVYSEAFEFTQKESFVVAELGFGIGLNFFLTLKRFLKAKIRPKRLFYVSLEGFYIEKEALREIYQKLGLYDEFKELLEQFLRFYPKCKDGIYRFYFENAFLDLVFADVSASLKELEFKADVWFLDGFNPRTNPQMFDENTIKEVARLSQPNASLHTFSASSTLQRTLHHCGFEVQVVKGFKKRQMIKAFLRKMSEFKDIEAYYAPIFNRAKNKKVAIIGAGIAGASLAFELGLRGFEVSVFEKCKTLGQGASGNESGILSTLILKEGELLGEFSQLAFYEASRFYRQILALAPNGALEIAHNLAMKKRFATQKHNPLFRMCDEKAFLEDAMSIKPKEIVASLLTKSKAKLYLAHEFVNFGYKNEEFSLHFKAQDSQNGFGVLIYALGADCKDFLPFKAFTLSKVRGQVTHLKPFLQTPFALSSKGYICPPLPNLQVIGASYDRINTDAKPCKKDDESNICHIQEFLNNDEKLEIIGSKVAFRSYSSDRFAVIGAFYDEEYYEKAYKSLLWSKNKAQEPPLNLPHLYINAAHGSRGFGTAIIAARYLCALINNEPLFLPKKFISCIHPARFLIRKLKKGL